MRRPLILLAVIFLSSAVAACADLSAPHHDDCPSGYVTSDGRMVCSDSTR